jgi:hypothetical protein
MEMIMMFDIHDFQYIFENEEIKYIFMILSHNSENKAKHRRDNNLKIN